MKKRKSSLLINIEYAVAYVVVAILKALPLKAAYAFGLAVSKLVFLLDSRHRRRAIRHILHSGIVDTKKEAAELAGRSMAHMSRTAVEIIKIGPILNETNAREMIELRMKQEYLDKYFTKGRSSTAIVVTAHLGNWELAGVVYSLFAGHHLSSIMRPLNNPKVGELVYTHRQNKNHTTYPKDINGLKHLLKALKNGESVAIVADQHASSSEGVETNFFNHPARSHSTPALLHMKTGIPILVGGVVRGEKGTFILDVEEVFTHEPTGDKEADIRAVTQRYTSGLEALIRRYPEQWLWAHRRWLDVRR